MKKGISLIVLVITIIVMIIIAGAIIISLSQTNVLTQAETARDDANDATVRSIISLVYANNLFVASGDTYVKNTAANLQKAINEELTKNNLSSAYTVVVDEDDLTTSITKTGNLAQ